MRALANIVSFFSMVFGFLASVLARWTAILDESLTTITAAIGLVGAVIWVFIALNKYRQGRISLKNEILDNEIKELQLKKLKDE